MFHPLLKEQEDFKKGYGQKIERYFWDKKEELLEKENKVQKQNKRLTIYDEILTNAFDYFLLNQKENFLKRRHLIIKNRRDFMLEGRWMVNTATMENRKETFRLWVKQAAEKQNLSKNLQKTNRNTGLQKHRFLHKEKKTFLLVFKRILILYIHKLQINLICILRFFKERDT